MPRTKGGPKTHRIHKKILDQTKGHRATKSEVYRKANESLIHSLRYAYIHRRERKGDFRRLWIARINAATRSGGLTYSVFMAGLKKAGVDLNRKVLADLAVTDPGTFASLLSLAKSQQVPS